MSQSSGRAQIDFKHVNLNFLLYEGMKCTLFFSIFGGCPTNGQSIQYPDSVCASLACPSKGRSIVICSLTKYYSHAALHAAIEATK